MTDAKCEPPPEWRDRDGWHWVGAKPRLWVAQFQMWESDIGGRMVPPDAYWLGAYSGPCLKGSPSPVTPPATVAALVQALEGLMVGSVWKDAHTFYDGFPMPAGWSTKRMPDDDALTAARAALAAYREAGR